METYPKLFKDIKIKYNDRWYFGYYEGDTWRVFTSVDGTRDKFIKDDEVQDWKLEHQ